MNASLLVQSHTIQSDEVSNATVINCDRHPGTDQGVASHRGVPKADFSRGEKHHEESSRGEHLRKAEKKRETDQEKAKEMGL